MTHYTVPSVQEDPAHAPNPLALPTMQGTTSEMLPDLDCLSLGERKAIPGSTATPAGPDSTPAAPRIQITINAYHGVSVMINAAPTDAARQGIQVRPAGGRLAFTNPARHVVVTAPTLPLAANHPPVGEHAPAPQVALVMAPTPDAGPATGPIPLATPAAVQAPAEPVASATVNSVPDNGGNGGNGGNVDDPDENIYPSDPSYTGKWYAVIVGRHVGIYPSWLICGGYVTGVPGNLHKSFKTCTEAYAYYLNKKINEEVYVVPE